MTDARKTAACNALHVSATKIHSRRRGAGRPSNTVVSVSSSKSVSRISAGNAVVAMLLAWVRR